MTFVAATLSWALHVDATGWNFLVDKAPPHDKVNFIEEECLGILNFLFFFQGLIQKHSWTTE